LINSKLTLVGTIVVATILIFSVTAAATSPDQSEAECDQEPRVSEQLRDKMHEIRDSIRERIEQARDERDFEKMSELKDEMHQVRSELFDDEQLQEMGDKDRQRTECRMGESRTGNRTRNR